MEVHALFEDGSASQIVLDFFAADPDDDPVRLACIGIEDRQMVNSAQNGCVSAYHLLAQQGVIKPTDRFFPSCQFADAQVNIQARGSSAGLAFCLKFASQVYELGGEGPPGSFAIAATGTVENSSRQASIGRVEGIGAKIRGALRVLKQGGLLFVPAANLPEVSEEIRQSLAHRGIELIPVGTVHEALQRLLPRPKHRNAQATDRKRPWGWAVLGVLAVLGVAGTYWGWEQSTTPTVEELVLWSAEGRYLEARAALEEALGRADRNPVVAQLYRQLKEPLGLQIEFHLQPTTQKNLRPEHLPMAPGMDSVEIAPGDLYRLSFTAADSIYLYAFRYGAAEGVEMLWPTTVIEAANPLPTGRKTYLPADTQSWFKDRGDRGPAQICLVAARRQSLDLERLYRRYEASAGKVRKAVGEELLEALTSRQKAHQAGLDGIFYSNLTLSVTQVP